MQLVTKEMLSFKEIVFAQEILEGIPSKNKNGDCYVKAYRYQESNPEVTLVHGLVAGQGPLAGIVYNHAWCEHNGKIIDMTLKPEVQKSLPIELYYAIGNIKVFFKYNNEERIEKVLDSGVYGPWEKKLKNNKY